MTVEPDLMIMIGIKGEVYPSRWEKFEKNYTVTDELYCEYKMRTQSEATTYEPTIRNRATGKVMKLGDYAKVCIANGGAHIYAKELTGRVKVFTAYDKDKYMLGQGGDYLAVHFEDKHDIYIVERDVFFITYDKL